MGFPKLGALFTGLMGDKKGVIGCIHICRDKGRGFQNCFLDACAYTHIYVCIYIYIYIGVYIGCPHFGHFGEATMRARERLTSVRPRL